MKKIFSLFAFSAILILGCGKDENPVDEVNTDQGYYPMSKGSTWTYWKRVDSMYSETTCSIIGDTTIRGNLYTIFFTTNDPGLPFQRRSGDTIFFLGDSYLGNGELVFLIDNPVGSKWSYSFTPTSLNDVKDEYILLNRENQRSILGKTFTDVIKVQATRTTYYKDSNKKIIDSGSTITDLYYAKRVGLIEYKSKYIHLQIKAYNIK